MSNDITVVRERAVFAPTQEDYKEMSVGEPQNMLEVRALAEYLAKSKFIPQSFRGDLNTAVMLIVTCKQYGLPITALSEVMEVNGKVGFWGRTKLGIVLKSGVCEYLIAKEKTDTKCVVVAKRKGWPEEVKVEWTIEQAEKAGLVRRSDAWQKYPKRMLYWRAISDAISEVFPDVIQGFSTVEELEEEPAQEAQVMEAPKELEMPKPKRTRKVKAVEEEKEEEPSEAILPPAEELETYDIKKEEKKDLPSDALFEAKETKEEEKSTPTRCLRYVKQVMMEGGVRYIVGVNPLNETLDKWVIPSASMASSLKKLTGTKVFLLIQDGKTVISYEECPA